MPELHWHVFHVVLRVLSESARLFTAEGQCIAVQPTAKASPVLLLLLLIQYN